MFAAFTLAVDDKHVLGAACIYDVDERHGTCWLEVNVAPEIELGVDEIEAQAWAHLVNHAFNVSGYRKAYLRFVEFDVPGLPRSVSGHEVARLPGHVRADGHSWDLVIWEVAMEQMDTDA